MGIKVIIKSLAFLIVLALLCGIIYIGTNMYKGVKSFKNSFAEDLPMTYEIMKEDSSLINSEYTGRIKVVNVRNSKLRGPISQLLIDNKFPLIFCKLDTTGLLSVKDSVIIQYKSSDRTTGIVYNIIEENLFYKFQYKAGKIIDNTSSILLTIAGDSLHQTIANDSLFGLQGLCKNLSISYSKSRVVDIFLEGKQKGIGTLPVPMDMLLWKRNRVTYFIIATTDSVNSLLPRNFLRSILSI